MGPEHLRLSCVRQAVLTIVVLMRYGLPTCQRSCVGEVAQGGGRWKSVVQWWQWAVSTAMIFARTFACKNAIWKATVPPRRAGHPGSVPGGKPSVKVGGSCQCCVVDIWAPNTSHLVAGNKERAGEWAVKCRVLCLASTGERAGGQRTCVV